MAVISAPPEEKLGVAEPEQNAEPADVLVPQAVFRKDYKPTPYLVDQVHLTFQLGEDNTKVLSELSFRPNYSGDSPPELFLNGRVQAWCSSAR